MSAIAELVGKEIAVRNAYEVKDDLKEGGYRWHPDSRTWRAPAGPRYAAVAADCADCAPEVRALIDAPKAAALPETPYPASRTAPWPHQRRMFSLLASREGSGLFCGMGTGKTKPVVDYIAAQPEPFCAVVVAPKTACSVWAGQVARHAAAPIQVLELQEMSNARRVKALENFARCAERDAHHGGRLLVVINYDAVRDKKVLAGLIALQPGLVVADEAHKIKSHNSAQSKAVAALGAVAHRRCALTGTPTPQGRLDAFGIYRFIDPAIFGLSWFKFRHRYAIYGGYGNHEIRGWQNIAEYDRLYASASMAVSLAEVAPDLPEYRDVAVPVTLGAEARRIYDALTEDMIARVDAGEIAPANALVELLRLQQLAGGLAVSETIAENGAPERHETVVDTAKRDALAELLEQAGEEPVVVFGQFRHDLRVAREVAESLGRRYGEISGARKDLDPGGLYPAGVHVLGVQISSGGAGIDLTRARIAIYLSTGFNGADYDQSRARLHRPGQTRGVTYYHIRAENTVDDHVAAVLGAKINNMAALLAVLKPGVDIASAEGDDAA